MAEFETTTWSKVETQLSPLDLIYFRGTDQISEFIMIIQDLTTGADDWSHAGLVVNRQLLPEVEYLVEGKWYVWESVLSSDFVPGTDGILDVETGRGYFGSQIRDLEQVVTAYSASLGHVGWGPLKDNPWKQIDQHPSLIRQFEYIHRTYCYTPFNANPFNCFAAAFPCLRPVRNYFTNDMYQVVQQDIRDQLDSETKSTITCLSCIPQPTPRDVARLKHKMDNRTTDVINKPDVRLFCSEMIALFFILIRLYPEDTDYRNVVPVDFYSGTDIDGLPAMTSVPLEFIPE